MRKIVGVFLVLSVFLVACGSPEPEFVCPSPYIQVGADCCLDKDSNGICDSDEQQTDEMADQEEAVSEEPSVTEDEAEPADTGKTDFEKFLEEINSRVKSYSYISTSDRFPQAKVRVRGGRIRISFNQPHSFEGNKIVDNIYLNSGAQSAIGYCTSEGGACRERTYQLDYHQLKPKTPVDWLEEFKASDPSQVIPSREIFLGRNTDLYVFRGKTITYRFSIDQHSKMPLRIERLSQPFPTTIIFKDLAINTVSDSEVQPPSQ